MYVHAHTQTDVHCGIPAMPVSNFIVCLHTGPIPCAVSCRITFQVCPLYIAEVASKERRGLLVAMVNTIATSGLVVSHTDNR